MKFRKKRRLWPWLALIGLLVGFWWFENFTLTTSYTEIPSEKVTAPIKIVLISDLHGQQFDTNNRKLINRIQAESPDLIFAVGDLYSSGDEAGKGRAVQLLSSFYVPVYFVEGEHDRDEDYLEALRQAGVHVLQYDTQTIEIKGTRLQISGIDNAYFSSTFDLNNAFDPPPADSLNLLLAHIPRIDAYTSWGADISFCGDTHGGVIRLPFLGPLQYEGIWFPKYQYAGILTDKGLFTQNGRYLYVTSGLGNYPVPMRLFNRPEIAVITIVPDQP